MKDATEIHLMSELSFRVTPLYIREGERRMKELEMQRESNKRFYQNLIDNNLLETYLKVTSPKPAIEKKSKPIKRPVRFSILPFFINFFN